MKVFRLIVLLSLLICATGVAATFVYTNNNPAGPNSVSAFAVSSSGVLTAIAGSPFATGGTGSAEGPYAATSVRISIVKNILYVSNNGSHDISVFSIDPVTGTLTAVAGSPFATGSTGDASLAVTPDNQYLYAGSVQTGSIFGFTIAANGALAPIAGFPIAAPDSLAGMTTTPDGKFLSVAVSGVNEVAMYAIDPTTGKLSAVSGSPFPAPALGPAVRVAGLDCNCAANRLFAGMANQTTTDVAVFAIDPTGALSQIAGSPFSGPGVNSNVPLLSPDDSKLFVSNQSSQSVDVFSVGAGGFLTLVTGSPFADAGQPAGMGTDAAGQWLFTANGISNSIGSFGIGPTGTLTAAPGSPFTAGIPANAALISLAVFPPKNCCPAPVISGASASPDSLWPPNHKFVEVTIDYSVTNPCPGSCVLTVASNEPSSDGTPEWIVVDAHHVQLQADRLGNGSGRIYTITITCTNTANGQSSEKQVSVVVPHDQRK